MNHGFIFLFLFTFTSAAFAELASPIEAPLPPLAPWKGQSEKLPAGLGHKWISPGEKSGLTASPSYDETRAFAEKMVAASPLLQLEVFGQTPQGREMFAIIARKSDSIRKPVLLAQAGIHSGEIDGKDAGLMLLRDIAFRGKDALLDKADFVFVPIFNIDGHERSSRFNRPNQRGPVMQGWRTTAQNLNLNRDYLKADSPEMQAMIGLIRKYDPALYLDLHVTDGTDHQYDVAFAFAGWDGLYAYSPEIGQWLDQSFRPAISGALTKAGHTPGYYVSAVDNRKRGKGIVHDAETSGSVLGFMSLATGGYIDFAFIRPEAQHTGLFRQLFELVIEKAGLKGEKLLWVHASLMAEPAFTKLGFAIIKREQVAIGEEQFERFEMHRAL